MINSIICMGKLYIIKITIIYIIELLGTLIVLIPYTHLFFIFIYYYLLSLISLI